LIVARFLRGIIYGDIIAVVFDRTPSSVIIADAARTVSPMRP
jgi:hypothetical protein